MKKLLIIDLIGNYWMQSALQIQIIVKNINLN